VTPLRAWTRGRRQAAAWGAGVAALYLAAALLSVATGLVRGRPLYDGLPKQPYRWVTPPPERAEANKPPAAAERMLAFKASGEVDPQSVSTGDLQAHVIFEKSLDAAEYSATGASNEVRLTITPLDPLTVGAKPAGRFFDTNAYRIEATYPSGKPVEACECDIVLTYAVHSTDVRRWTGTEWAKLERLSADRSGLQIYGFTPMLGTFVATGPGDVPKEPEAASRPTRPALIYIVLGLGAALGVGVAIFTGRRKTPPAKAKPAPKKGRGR
jgi:hypothetical protein